MGLFRQTLLASLLTGSTLGAPLLSELAEPEEIDALARSFAADPHVLAQGIDARIAQLRMVGDDSSAWLELTQETLGVVAPLADRMGLSARRAGLEDESFRLLQPESHARLSEELGTTPDADAARLADIIDAAEILVADLGLPVQVTGRVKSRYSLHSKMQRKGLALSDILDRIALRVHVDEDADCYAVIDAIHSRWSEVPDSTDDYVASPKPNGYRSLHTAVVLPDSPEPVEFQVRTHAMHELAESGDAAHWRYKLPDTTATTPPLGDPALGLDSATSVNLQVA
jgi:(p)ppGpp synthase/HD superfamily hydrolase